MSLILICITSIPITPDSIAVILIIIAAIAIAIAIVSRMTHYNRFYCTYTKFYGPKPIPLIPYQP